MIQVRKLFSYISGAISLVAILLASGIKDTANWETIAAPFFWIWALSLCASLILYNWNSIRRITYPTIICIWAWAYEHKILSSTFSKHTYQVYVKLNKSYTKLYLVVQNAFDQYLAAYSGVE